MSVLMLFRLVFLALLAAVSIGAAHPVVIAHRGASGYLPEHTLEAAAYAHALGVDFIEQDVVMAKDGTLVVCHDIHLDTTTDVAVRFPTRHRADGRYYAIDFTWDELRTLQVRERFDAKTGRSVFPQRFPSSASDTTGFRLCTLEESIALIQGLNRSTGRKVGIYPEIKAPAWHAQEGRDLGRAVLKTLARFGYVGAADHAYVQCFDPAELKRLRAETKLKLVQLIGENSWGEAVCDYDAMRTPAGLREVAAYAQGIGPNLTQLLGKPDVNGELTFTPLVADAHAAGLLVHPYTLRADALPPGFASFEAWLQRLIPAATLDGFFTDHPAEALRFLRK